MKKLLTLCLICFCLTSIATPNIYLHPLSTKNQAEFNKVQAMLSKADNLSGEFKQTRKMALLSAPLVSTGHFVLSKKHGLQWKQTTPFKSTLIVTATEIKQQIGDSPPNIITKAQQPIVFSFTNVFLSVFNGNAQAIKDYFKIYFIGNTSAWKIALKPIGSPLNKAIVSIEMSGGKYINFITVNEAKNNQMLIHLFNIKEA